MPGKSFAQGPCAGTSRKWRVDGMSGGSTSNWPPVSYIDESTGGAHARLAELELVGTENWRRLYRHKGDGSYWALDEPDKYQERSHMGVKGSQLLGHGRPLRCGKVVASRAARRREPRPLYVAGMRTASRTWPPTPGINSRRYRYARIAIYLVLGRVPASASFSSLISVSRS